MDSNRDLFWNLVEPEYLKARAFCRKLMGNREDGDDLFQDALVRALTRFRTLRDPESFSPWFYKIIYNTFKNRIRQPWWRRMVSMTGENAERLQVASANASVETKRRLAIAFRALKPDEHSLVVLHELQGWSIAELSRMTGKSEGSVRVRLHRAKRKMLTELVRYQKKAESTSTSTSLAQERLI